MKFFSKNANLRIVLRPGLPAEPLSGRSAQPGLYVKFENGIAIVNDDKMLELMRSHHGYNMDFIEEKGEQPVDPFANKRKNVEPEHDLAEINYGHMGKNLNPKPAVTIRPEMMEYIKDMAREMAKEMTKEALKTIIDNTKKTLPQEEMAPASEIKGEAPKKRKAVSKVKADN